MKYFQLLNPHFLLQVAKAMMVYAPTEVREREREREREGEREVVNRYFISLQPAPSPSQADPVLRKAGSVLDPLTKSAPAMIQMLYLLARIKFLSGS